MDFSSRWSLRTFNGFNVKFDGGIFRALARNNTPAGAFIPPGFIQSWLTETMATPFFNVASAILVLWGLFVPIFGAILFVRFTTRHSRRRGKCKSLDNLLGTLAKSTAKCKCANKKKKSGRSNWSRNIIMITCLLGFLLLFFFVLLHYPLYWGSRVTAYMTDSNSSVSLNSTVDNVISYSKLFLTDGLKSANTTTTTVVANLGTKITRIMSAFISEFLKYVLIEVNISQIFKRVEHVLNEIVSLTNAMDIIRKARTPLLKDIDVFRGQIKAVQPILLNTFPALCNNSQRHFREQCLHLQRDVGLLGNNFSAKNIQFDSSTAAITYLEASNVNIIAIRDDFLKSRDQLIKLTEKMKAEMLRYMPMNIFSSSLTSLWISLEKEVERNVIQPIDKFRYSNPIQDVSVQLNAFWTIFFGIAWSFLLIFGIFVTLIVLLAVAGIIWTYREKKRKQLLFQFINPALPVYTGKEDNNVMQRGTSYLLNMSIVFHSSWGLIVVVSFATGIILFCLSGALSSEACRYLVETEGVKVADPLIDTILRREWDRLVANANLSQVVIPVTLKPPQHVLRTLFTCSNTSTAILPALSMTGMLNFSQLPNLPQFSSLVGEGRKLIDKNIGRLNLKSMVSSRYIEDMKQAVRFLKIFARRTDFSISITALEKPLFTLSDYKGFVERLGKFYKAYNHSSTRLRSLQAVVNTFEESIVAYDALETQLTNLSYAFQKLQTFPNLTTNLEAMITDLNETMTNLQNNTFLSSKIDGAYAQAMEPLTGKLVHAVERSFHELETSIFMCYNLHLAYFHFTTGMCGHFRTGLNFVTIHFFFILIWFQILYTIVWIFLYYLERLL